MAYTTEMNVNGAVTKVTHLDHSAQEVDDAVELAQKLLPRNGSVTLHHTGNKPSGSYTGNGSAASRTINVGGLGNVIEIHSSKGSAIVNAVNGLCYSSAGVAVVASTQAKMVDGVLTLATDNDKLNANGVTYYYQVL